MSFEGNGGPQPQRLFAVRGATQVDANEAEPILAATEALMRELIERNGLEPTAMVSCLFTTTEDLDAEFPAVAARGLGLEAVPLLCCREIPVPGSMPRVIRVLLHLLRPRGPHPRPTPTSARRRSCAPISKPPSRGLPRSGRLAAARRSVRIDA